MQKLQEKPTGRRLTKLWVFAFIVLTAGTIWVMLTTQPPSVEIPYSYFVDQVRAKNVTQLHISDDQIAGSFTNSIRWAPESNAPIADADALYPSGTYTRFTTYIPTEMGDAQLMSLLGQHQVQVVAASLARSRFVVWLRNGLPIALMLAVAAWIIRLGNLQSRALRSSSAAS